MKPIGVCIFGGVDQTGDNFMITYCSESGFPLTSSSAQKAGAPFPDFLEDQQAHLGLMCDCGATSAHQVLCSLQIDAQRTLPPKNRVERIICPACGQENRLLRPLVIHHLSQQRVILRLPESFRHRSYAALRWWFDCLQQSTRAVIPPYAAQPQIEFIPAEIINRSHKATTKEIPPPQGQRTAPRSTREALSLSASLDLNRDGQVVRKTVSLKPVNASESQKHQELASTQTPTDFPDPLTEPPHVESMQMQSPQSIKPEAIPSLSPSQEPVAIHKSPLATQEIISPPDDDDDPLVPENLLRSEEMGEVSLHSLATSSAELAQVKVPPVPAEAPPMVSPPAPNTPKQTLSYGSDAPAEAQSMQARSYPNLESSLVGQEGGLNNVSELELPEEEFELLEELEEDEDIPTLMVSAHKEPTVRAPRSAIERAPDTNQKTSPKVEAAPPLTEEASAPKEGTQPEVLAIDDFLEEEEPEAFPNVPTVARPAPPETLQQMRQHKQQAATAVRQMAGAGISISQPQAQPTPLAQDIAPWKNSGKSQWMFVDLMQQQVVLAFHTPPGIPHLLDQGAQAEFLFQLHRLPHYPLLMASLVIVNNEGELLHSLDYPIDIEDTQALMGLDCLMQDFKLRLQLCDDKYMSHRDLQVNLPLEKNVEYLLNEARIWMESLAPSAHSFQNAKQTYEGSDFDRLGKMSHNFNQESFSDLSSPAMTRLAVGIMAYWSEAEQFDYLISIKSFPRPYFREIQHRVLRTSIELGIYMPEHLMQRAVELSFAPNIPQLLQKTIANFAEVNLQIRHNNDLDTWDNLENWQKLLEACDEYSVEVDQDIEELAETAQRRAQQGSAEPIEVDDFDDLEVFEDYQDMSDDDLLDLLQEPEHQSEAGIALAQRGQPAHLDDVAAIYPELSREEATPFAEAFVGFGPESESFLLSWLHLPRPYQREAAMMALGSMGSVQAIDSIIKRLRSGDEWEAAAEAIGRIGEAALPPLERELKNKNWLIRLRAIKALKKINSPAAHQLILSLSNDSSKMVQEEVASLNQ